MSIKPAALATDRRVSLALSVGVPAGVAVVAMLSSLLVSDRVAAWNTAWTASSLSATMGMAYARARAAPAHRFRWTMMCAASASWLIGQIIWNLYPNLPGSPNLVDVADWSFAVLTIIGVVYAGSHARPLRMLPMIETSPLIAAAMALSLALMWPYVVGSRLDVAAKASLLAYPALYGAAAIVTLQAILGGWLRERDTLPTRLVLVGIVVQAIAFAIYSRELMQGVYQEGHSVLDPLWALGLLAIAAGGVLVAREPDPVAGLSDVSPRSALLPAGMFTLLCAALVEGEIDHRDAVIRLALTCGVIFAGSALLLRGMLLSRRLQVLLVHERGTVANLAERESELNRINRRLVEDSRHDPLTGMRNRRALAHDLPRFEQSHREHGEPFAIAICDVDHFKSYNDRLGHLAGDQALRAVARTLRTALREDDLCYRFGGEELLVLMHNTRGDEAVHAAERLRVAVLEEGLPHPEGADGVLTISVGVAAGTEDASALLARADAALYEAKRSGRNRVVSAPSNGPLVPGRRSEDVELVPRQLRSMLAVSRAAAAGAGPMPVLQALAETIRIELSFDVVAVALRDFEQSAYEVAVVLGDPQARTRLLGCRGDWSDVEQSLRPEYERRGAIWIPGGSTEVLLPRWRREARRDPSDPAAWDPDDVLVLPVRGADGTVLAFVSVDSPLSGRRPEDSDLTVLMAVADHAGLALERVKQERERLSASDEQASELRLAAVMLLAETLDMRDPGTGRHSRTVGIYARHIAQGLGLSEEHVERISAAGVLHDLGKLGMADAILYKPGPLDTEEYREIMRHPEIGERILEHAGLQDLATWVRCHHERVDGAGYPDGLNAEQIPLEGRILAVADSFEAMIADRPYRRGMSRDSAQRELLRASGSQFDRSVVEAFLTIHQPTVERELQEIGVYY